MFYSPFGSMKLTVAVEWDKPTGIENDTVRFEVPAEPDLVEAGVVDKSDPLDWTIDTDALEELVGRRLLKTANYEYGYNWYTYSFSLVPKRKDSDG